MPPTMAMASPCDDFLVCAAGASGGGAGGTVGLGWAMVFSESFTRDASPSLTSVASLSPGTAWPAAAIFRAMANSRPFWKRSSGRFASAFRIRASRGRGTWTLSTDGAAGSSFSTLCMMVVSAPVKGFSPVRNW